MAIMKSGVNRSQMERNMNNRNTDSLDMIAELFIPLRTKMEYLIPPKSEEEYLLDLEQGTDLAKKTEALHALI